MYRCILFQYDQKQVWLDYNQINPKVKWQTQLALWETIHEHLNPYIFSDITGSSPHSLKWGKIYIKSLKIRGDKAQRQHIFLPYMLWPQDHECLKFNYTINE